ncbi:MAG: M20/M25/M40 family metallo-hydrolase [Chromatocurvus sp.]
MIRFLSIFPLLLLLLLLCIVPARSADLSDAVQRDYDEHLGALFEHFHRNPELSYRENATAARIAEELRGVGFEVTEGVGETGVVAIMENGDGPLVMMRADMDGLPVEEKSGLPYASAATQVDRNGVEQPVMHACGHDVHITGLVGTARQMAARRDEWSGTLMLIGQPAEEVITGARTMMEDRLWERFGQPDHAMAFHVAAAIPTGKLSAVLDYRIPVPTRWILLCTASVPTARVRIRASIRCCWAHRSSSACSPSSAGHCHRARRV